ncbi:hypothetical protein BAnh1_02780 [Bartonella australis AUST/NH1]|uniref:DUF1561 domain-containing protein n=1 Tax=Bartonella australis (strain Aust/NH1) TaxID=1094489 RepID=M1PC03_BARAA|nr:DUF1561 family protein [Bartonella australis]AGF74161.1 hypothetical protein BAnh1_02780 [Bartonella australis AUST/NH1]
MKYCGVLFVSLDNCSFKKKSNLKCLLLFCVFLLFINSLFAAPVPPISQKLADEPIEKPIRIKAHNRWEYCYAPAFVDGESYVYINNCSSSSVQSARYDVFQRIAWKVNDVWLCMTAPNSVTGVDRKATADWDYIRLRPCVINDPNQRWIITGRALYTADKQFRVKDHKWYAYISKNKGDYYDHTLSSTMDEWINTIAAPGNMSLKTSLGWKFTGTSGFNIYYISDDGSKPEIFDLYYNPENGHIARYFPSAGLLSCMASQQSFSENWNWVAWKHCNDNILRKNVRDSGYWNVSFLVGREGPLLDYRGNFLRVTQYGSNWGVPYTAKPNYLKTDTQNAPKSEFVLSYDIERWNRYAMANVEDSLPYCPAPGKKQDVSGSKQRIKRNLPSDFQLTEEWLQRLYAIATSTTSSTQVAAGICGICFIQALQMVAELQESYPGLPRARGYFFDPAPNVNPLFSLRQRYPLLNRALQLANVLYGVSLAPGERGFAGDMRAAAAVTQVALPNFDWELSVTATGQDDIRSSVQRLLTATPGTIWIGLSIFTLPDGRVGRHTFPILRSPRGLVIIPTNISMFFTSFASFSQSLVEVRDVETILPRLVIQQGSTLNAFATLRLVGTESRPLSVMISQNNCTGEGGGRRGNKRYPSSDSVNQCTSGRCTLL